MRCGARGQSRRDHSSSENGVWSAGDLASLACRRLDQGWRRQKYLSFRVALRHNCGPRGVHRKIQSPRNAVPIELSAEIRWRRGRRKAARHGVGAGRKRCEDPRHVAKISARWSSGARAVQWDSPASIEAVPRRLSGQPELGEPPRARGCTRPATSLIRGDVPSSLAALMGGLGGCRESR